MNVNYVLVDDIAIASESASATATLYGFPKGGWLSIHERDGRRVGPMTAVDIEPGWATFQDLDVTHLGARPLHVRLPDHIFYRDVWTPPPGGLCVFCLVLPHGFIIDNSDHWLMGGHEGYLTALERGVAKSPENRVFGFALVNGPFRTEVVLKRDERECEKFLDSIDVVASTGEVGSLFGRVSGPARSADFWWKLIELGTRFMGG